MLAPRGGGPRQRTPTRSLLRPRAALPAGTRTPGSSGGGTLGDGAVLTTATLFFAVIRGFGEGVVGPALGGGALLGLVLSVPLGRLADRIGLARSAAAFSVVAATAMVLFAVAQTPAVYVAELCAGARIIGPAVLLPVVIAIGLPAWLALGLIIAGAATALAGVLRRSTINE